MNVRQLAAAAALVLGAASAQAATFLSSFTVVGQQDITAAAGSPPGEILSFEVLSVTADVSDIMPNLASITYFDLGPGAYTLKLVTSGSAIPDLQVVDGNATVYALTPVPEPESYALGLAGLSVAALLLRRRRAAV